MKVKLLPIYKEKSNIFVSFLEVLHVKHTKRYSNKFYGEHPHKYNLYGLSTMLSDYKIENKAIRIKSKEQTIFELETPFIAHIGHGFLIVTKITQEKVFYLWNGRKITLPVEKFIEVWTGIILLAEPDENSVEPNYVKNRREELFYTVQNSIFILFTCLLVGIAYITQTLYHSLGLTLLLATNVIGIYIGYLLVLKQMHIHSRYVDKICSLFKQHDCNNILESKAAKFLGVISWSEMGFGYFISNAIIILFLPQLIFYSAIVNICVLPYTVWSIWYQRFRAKQWCPLCIIVQFTLWGLFAINLLFDFIQLPAWIVTDILLTICIYTISYLVIDTLANKFSEARKVRWLIQEIKSIKADENVFMALLKKQPYYHVDKLTSQILWGNPNAAMLLTVFTNPHCAPCALMNKRIEKLLESLNNNICVQYIFSSFNEQLASSNKYLIVIYLNNEVKTAMSIFSEWFTNGKLHKEEFAKKYRINIENNNVEEEFLKHEKWKETSALRATPTILVNGYKLPENYVIEDLIYFKKTNKF
jgi:thiol-disulfide isomerase/thioredoxin